MKKILFRLFLTLMGFFVGGYSLVSAQKNFTALLLANTHAPIVEENAFIRSSHNQLDVSSFIELNNIEEEEEEEEEESEKESKLSHVKKKIESDHFIDSFFEPTIDFIPYPIPGSFVTIKYCGPKFTSFRKRYLILQVFRL